MTAKTAKQKWDEYSERQKAIGRTPRVIWMTYKEKVYLKEVLKADRAFKGIRQGVGDD